MNDTRTTENPARRLLLDVVGDLRWSNGNPVTADWLTAMLDQVEAEAAQGAEALTCDNCGHTMDWRCHPPQGAAPRAEGLGDYHRDRVARERQDPEFDAEYRAARSTPAETLDPSEIRDLDMALRYALLDHDMGCHAIGMEDNCTCPARGHAVRARAIVKRIGAPYRLPSGDYDPARLSPHNREAEHITEPDTTGDPLSCWCGPYRDNDEPQVIIHRKEGEA